MNRNIVLLYLAVSLLVSCEKDEPCDALVNGVYQFPELPDNHTMTSKEVTKFWDLPEDISGCITTEGLIETCLNYPDLRLIMAGSSPQSGYDLLVKERFLGIRELERREDRGTYLLEKFKAIDPLGYDPNWEPVEIGAYNFNIYYLEIIFSQYVNLEVLTKSEQIELIETALVVYDKMKEDSGNYSLFGLECTSALLGRLMYVNGYSAMIDLYNYNDFVYILLEIYGPTNPDTVELVYNLSKEYLHYLNKNLS